MKYVTALLSLLVLNSCTNSPFITTGQEGRKLPNFSLLRVMDSTRFSANIIPEGKATIMFYFSPNCTHCQAEIKLIQANDQDLGNMQFYFLSPAALTELKMFYEKYQIKNFSNMTVVQDDSLNFQRYFGVPAVPYVAVYDSHKYLRQVIFGQFDIKDLRNILIR